MSTAPTHPKTARPRRFDPRDARGMELAKLFEKLPPHAPEAEAAVLGSMILDWRVSGDVLQAIKAEDFYKPAHAAIYDVLIDLYDRNQSIDMVQLNQKLKDKQVLDQVGGVAYLVELAESVPSAASIANAWVGGEPYKFNGNVANDDLVENLPQDACVEVPVLASRNRLEPIRVGALPAPCAMLTGLSAQIEMLTVEGCLTGNPRLIYPAVAHDPLTAARLSLNEIKQMVQEMLHQNRPYLPCFERLEL